MQSPMTTTSTTLPFPAAQLAAALPERAARTALPYRLAMRVGLWLLLWASRPRRTRRITAAEAAQHRRGAEEFAELERRRLDLMYLRGPIR